MNRELRGFTLPVSDLRHDSRLRAAIRGFITENDFEADAAVLPLLRFAPRASSPGPWQPAAGLRPWTTRQAELWSGFVDLDQLGASACDGAGDACADCADRYGTPDGRYRRRVRRAGRTAASGGDREDRRLDRWESALRRMHGVIDALDTVLSRLGRMRVVRVVLFLVVAFILTRYPELWNGISIP